MSRVLTPARALDFTHLRRYTLNVVTAISGGVQPMPTYEYQCEKCGSTFEIRHPFDADPPETCRADGCDGTLRRVFSPPTIIFKGSGWHVTDYGRGNGNGKPSPPPDEAEHKSEDTVEAAD
jgi:putative FmdB family regulatory protein